MKAANARFGFTLIELLVVISIIALLIGILLPALGQARKATQQLVNQANHRTLGQGQAFYMNDNQDYYAGPNTSGAFYARVITNPFVVGFQDMIGNQSSVTPTSTYDWISPTLGDSYGLSVNRARRTAQIFNDFGDPSAAVFNDTLFGNAPDRNDFRDILATDGYRQISYLSPVNFHWLSNEQSTNGQAGRNGPVIPIRNNATRFLVGFSDPVTTPSTFRPRLDRVGRVLSDKVLVADGTRFVTEDRVLDFDIGANPNFFGSFTDSSPIDDESNAWGRLRNPDHDDNVLLSFRHGNNNRMVVTRFDGSVAVITETEARTNPNPWYPSGSIWTGGSRATEESIEFMEQQGNGRENPKIY